MWKMLLRKRLKGVIGNITPDTYQRAGLAKKLWETLSIPSILYGDEVFDLAYKHRLEIIERRRKYDKEG